MPRSRSPRHKRHGSRSKSPKHHGRSKSPKHHSRSKSPKHKHKPHGHHKPHHKKDLCDMWWDDLPNKAMKKAKILGYNERKWDNDKNVPSFRKSFDDLSMKEKKAAAFLGIDIFEEHDDLDEDWADLSEEVKEYLTKLGYTEELWDNDEEAECEEKNWEDLNDDEKEGARYFGYTKATWDEEGEDEDDSDDEEPPVPIVEAVEETIEIPIAEPVEPEGEAPEPEAEPEPEPEPEPMPEPAKLEASAPPMAAAEPDDEEEEEEEEAPKFFMTRNFGGEGGSAFDHMNRRRITKISVRAGKFVDGIGITYMNGAYLFNGGEGGEEQSIELPEGEYVNEVKLNEGNVIQGITFITNKGRTLGPCGSGKGGGLFAKEGNPVHVKAPEGYRLVGIRGREGKWLDAIGFRWGPVPGRFR